MSALELLSREAAATQVAVMAGGEGKRMGLIGVPKPLITLNGVPLLDRCIRYLASSGFQEFAVLARHEEVARRASEVQFGVKVRVCRDPPLPKVGKGKALKHALETGCLDPGRRVLVAFPDDVFLDGTLPLRFLASHLEAVRRLGVWASVAVVAGLQLPYGVVEVDALGLAVKFEEKPSLRVYASTGLYIFEPQALKLLSEVVDMSAPRAVEFENTLLPLLADRRRLNAFVVPQGAWMSVNTLKELEEAEEAAREIEKKVPLKESWGTGD
ncbi:MAG: sugar phosphate nucleotidyltransferase [Thermofilum sp.]